MLFSEAKGRAVVSTSTADTVAKVAGYLVDPGARSVVGVRVKKSKSGDVIAWSSVTAFGADAVTVASADVIVDVDSDANLMAVSSKDSALLGKRVLSTTGTDLGKVDDVEFDAETGAVTGVIVDGEKIDGKTLTGVGSYAVVLDHRE